MKKKIKFADPRACAAQAIEQCLRAKQPLDDILEQISRTMVFNDDRDYALTKAIAMATMRHLGILSVHLYDFLNEPLSEKHTYLEAILLTGAAQITLLNVPDHAAVNESVNLAKHDPKLNAYAKLINAFLRHMATLTTVEPFDPLSQNTPPWLVKRWTKNYGLDQAQQIARAHISSPPLDISIKTSALKSHNIEECTSLKNGTIRINNHIPLQNIPGFQEGDIWAQDTSSRYPVLFMGEMAGKTALDMCAAPGGKTMQMIDMGANVTALDRSKGRMWRLQDNLKRLQMQATVHVCDALEFQSKELFDFVLLDAPCTATGTIRRQPDIAWLKIEDDVYKLAQQQTKLLQKAAELTKKGGILIYATCSLEPEEGEQQITQFLQHNQNFKCLPITTADSFDLPQSVTPEGFFRILPHHLEINEQKTYGSGGFFVARLQRLA